MRALLLVVVLLAPAAGAIVTDDVAVDDPMRDIVVGNAGAGAATPSVDIVHVDALRIDGALTSVTIHLASSSDPVADAITTRGRPFHAYRAYVAFETPRSFGRIQLFHSEFTDGTTFQDVSGWESSGGTIPTTVHVDPSTSTVTWTFVTPIAGDFATFFHPPLFASAAFATCDSARGCGASGVLLAYDEAPNRGPAPSLASVD